MLAPHSDYVLTGAVLLKKTTPTNNQLCGTATRESLEKHVATILNTEICLLHSCYQQLEELIYKNSLHIGGLLWRMIDR